MKSESSVFRKTKIICTIGPATSDKKMIQALAEAGMNVARLNMSHGNHDFHRSIIRNIKSLNKDVLKTSDCDFTRYTRTGNSNWRSSSRSSGFKSR
ncbi:pyruvate kinase, barrel domain protein [Leptospira interrogans serovar Copenhageni str. LT2050]|uniref:pyruvate kinase n=1 Tax=Leptospira interrogans serovar Copenhageni str. LT2050 TaxID=1001598 RepID=M3H5N8_LEPIT|nr:pyruvate kinase, barrel domain protein [Leptospira interrogans serovar Copenhageni str. LT2050]